MLLSGTVLKNVQSVNSFERTTNVMVRQGNPTTLYIQLIDLEQTDSNGQSLRYMPASGASMTITLGSIDSTKGVNRLASQPYSSDDRSIWSLNILSTDQFGQGNINFTLTEGSTVRTATILNGIVIWATNSGTC